MYVHVIGWETAKKDKIDLEGSRLKEKQGLYTCPPGSPQQLPFHCCLEVKEEQIKVQPDCIPSSLVLCSLEPVISCCNKLCLSYVCNSTLQQQAQTWSPSSWEA